MYTYEVWIRSPEYHGKKPLTYTSLAPLKVGSVVKVDLKNKSTIGLVRRGAKAPRGVAMKPISQAYTDGQLTVPPEHLRLISWLLQYYPAGSGSITQLFLPASWPKDPVLTGSESTPRNLPKLPALTKQQSSAIKEIRKNPGSFLLHGETGSGKTRVYIEAIKDTLKQGRSALVLVPEIGLTPHLIKQLQTAFPADMLSLFHSGLTPVQRKAAWTHILSTNRPQIVVGPRSALFSPLHNIGIIVVDECHDDGYKQENAPYYHGLRVASRLAYLHNATLIFGSATPSITDVFIAAEKHVPILRMTDSAKTSTTNRVDTKVVNRKDKLEFGTSPHISNTLLNEITTQLSKKQQSLLFLNRRGSARVIACNNCGWRALCPNCELPLTLHEDIFALQCHTCGYRTNVPTQCPECNNLDIIFYGPGTKAVEKEIQRIFPEAKVARFDGDNLTHERLDKHFDAVQQGTIDIIIGTQILIKGFDIPQLGLVGIIDADSSLSFPDFRTEEQSYQVISQASGRVGRGHVQGTVVVQTLTPDSPLLMSALNKDWESFYSQQLQTRKLHHFPPFTFLLKLECLRKRQESAASNAAKLKKHLSDTHPAVQVLGPAPAFRERQQQMYSWQLVIKSTRRSTLLEIIADLPSGWKYDIDPTHLL